MSNKPFIDGGKADKNMSLIVRIGVGLIMLIALSMMFVFNPGENADKFSSETLWEAVHPFNWFLDTVAMAGFIFFALFIAGLAGKTVYKFVNPPANSSGLISVIAVVSMLAMILFFV
jgi:hypothetical protein